VQPFGRAGRESSQRGVLSDPTLPLHSAQGIERYCSNAASHQRQQLIRTDATPGKNKGNPANTGTKLAPDPKTGSSPKEEAL